MPKISKTKKLIRSRFVFTRRPNPAAMVKSAEGVYFLLRDRNSGTDFEQEGKNLAAVLGLIFPRQTLAFLKSYLSGN